MCAFDTCPWLLSNRPKSGLNTRCEVSWTNKECGKNAGLDKDDKDGMLNREMFISCLRPAGVLSMLGAGSQWGDVRCCTQ